MTMIRGNRKLYIVAGALALSFLLALVLVFFCLPDKVVAVATMWGGTVSTCVGVFNWANAVEHRSEKAA